jgi:hypothetical protein
MTTNKFLYILNIGLSLLIYASFSSSVNAQEFEPSYNPFTGQPNANSYVIYSTAPNVYTNHHRHYYAEDIARDPYSFCYHNGKAYSEGSKIKHKRCIKSGFPNTPMSWED